MRTIQLHFFGPGVILDQNGQPIPMRSRKQLALLVYLATEHQNTHSRETLLALFWPEETTTGAQNNLRVTLSRLRELAGKLGAADVPPGELLITDRTHVQLHPAWIDRADTNHFHRLLDGTRQHAHASRSQCTDCQEALIAAVQLYQGNFLEGFGLDDCPAFEEWLFMQRERRHLLVIEAYGDLAAYAEANGNLAAARGFAQRQIEIDPLREPAYRQQMRILAKQGERSLALTTFERCRTVLREELGLDPEPETLSLHAQILKSGVPGSTGDEQPRADAGRFLAGSPAVVATPHANLPQQLTPFIGREEDLAQFQQRLQAGDSRLLSIVGPGGMGKTRLALQIAAENLHRFADGVCFVPLAGVQSAAAIPAAIMDALGASFVTGATSPTQQLFALLAKRELLLVIDNVEHLMDGVALLLEVLQAAPQVTLLVTTREQLNCQAEDLFTLQGLATPPQWDLIHAGQYAAVRLFCDRAYRLTKHFKLTTENSPDVVKICQLVEGLPLAIELATTWLRDFDCADLAATLAKDQSLLATTQQDVPIRHRSMQGVFHHSWQLLSAAEQRILSQLAVCPGRFSTSAAAAMTGASLVDLTHLRYKSLLRSAGSGYYEFHPLIRGFAVAMLAPEVDLAMPKAAEARMAMFYLQQVAAQSVQLQGATPKLALQSISRELDNVQQAWQWAARHAKYELLLKSVRGLGEFYLASGRNTEGEAYFLPLVRQLLAQADTGQVNPVRLDETSRLLGLHLLDEACRSLFSQSKLSAVVTWAQILVGLAQAAANQEFEARGHDHWGFALSRQGQSIAARQKLEEALVLARHIGRPQLIARILHNLGATLAETGKRQQGEACLQESLQIQRNQGNRIAEQRTLIYLSRVRHEDRDYQGERSYLVEAIHLLQLTGNRQAESRIVNVLGCIEAMLGNYAAALEYHASSRRISQEIHEPVQESHALHNLCTVQRKMGNLPMAEAYGQEALRLALAYEQPDAASYARLHLGYVWLACGDLEEASAAFQLAADDWQQQQRTNLVWEATVGLAAVADQSGNLAYAATLITPIVPLLVDHVLEGVDEPFEMVLSCYQVLTALQDPRVDDLLATAYAQLQILVSKITDRELRQSFWHAPAHRKLRALWQQSHKATGQSPQ